MKKIFFLFFLFICNTNATIIDEEHQPPSQAPVMREEAFLNLVTLFGYTQKSIVLQEGSSSAPQNLEPEFKKLSLEEEKKDEQK